MIVPDTNILIYAFNASVPQHRQAASWWEEAVNSGSLIGVPAVVFLSFVRLLTGRQIVDNPYTAEQLFGLTDEWWERPSVRLLHTTEKTFGLFRTLVEKYNLSGSATSDALIAAFVVEHRGLLISNDTDFLRFKEIKVENPFD